jgi:hypothetical protein
MSARTQTQNARNFDRYKYITDLSITYEGYGEEVRLHTPDISSRGMFIHTSLDLPEGSIIRVKFRLRGSGQEVVARSEVRYCLPGVGIGVEFVEISPDARQAISDELAVDS